MERVKLRLCLACLALAVSPYLLGLGLIGWLAVNTRFCESTDHAVTSPTGQFTAQIVTVGCGGPIIGASTEVRLRVAEAVANSKGETVFNFSKPPHEIKAAVAWTSEKHLVIERLCVDGYLYWALSQWSSRGQPGITISYRCLDHHSEG